MDLTAPVEVSFVAPPAIGPLGPTALQYTAPQFIPEQLREEDGSPTMRVSPSTLDETDLANGPISTTGDLNVNFAMMVPEPSGQMVASQRHVKWRALNWITSGGVPVLLLQQMMVTLVQPMARLSSHLQSIQKQANMSMFKSFLLIMQTHRMTMSQFV